jgi:hypothetical protein
MWSVSPVTFARPPGTRDGTGAGDHDQPLDGFRRQLFNTRQLARLLLLRSEVLEARLGGGRWAADLANAHTGLGRWPH